MSEKLKQEILRHSYANDFNIAKNEWELQDFRRVDKLCQCPCCNDIDQIALIRNKINKKLTCICSDCANKFLGIDKSKLINTVNLKYGIKLLRENPKNAKPNPDVITWAKSKDYITTKNVDFLLQVHNQSALTQPQENLLEFCNKKILDKLIPKDNDNVCYGDYTIDLDTGLKELKANPKTCRPCRAVITYAESNKYITERDGKFLLDITNQVKLSHKQKLYLKGLVKNILKKKNFK